MPCDQPFYHGRVVKFGVMAARHGTRARYKAACRCDACRAAQASYQARYRDRVVNGETRPRPSVVPPAGMQVAGPGDVELATVAELAGLSAAAEQPGLAAAAVAMAKVLDHPRALSPKPSAAKQLIAALDTLRMASARHRGGGLRAVRAMTDKGGA